jgi:hypothetical protein
MCTIASAEGTMKPTSRHRRNLRCGPFAQKSARLREVLARITALKNRQYGSALLDSLLEQHRLEGWLAQHSHVER